MATGAPRVEISITDNSLYTETTLGTNGGMVVVTPYGPKEPKFIQQWKDFLSTYFDRDDLPMSADRSVYEAYNFFTESAGAWCVRAVGTGALCSGAKFSNGLNNTENESLSVGVENPSDVILDDKQDYNLQLMLPYPGVNDKYSVKLYTYRPNLNFSPEEVLLETTEIDNVPEVQLDDVQAIIRPKFDNSFSIAVPLDSFQDGDEIVIRPNDSQSILPEPLSKNSRYYVKEVSVDTDNGLKYIRLYATYNDWLDDNYIEFKTKGTGTFTAKLNYVYAPYEGSFLIQLYKDNKIYVEYLCSFNPDARDESGKSIFIESVIDTGILAFAYTPYKEGLPLYPKSQTLNALPLTGGAQGETPGVQDWINALNKMSSYKKYKIRGLHDSGGFDDPDTHAKWQDALTTFCENRPDTRWGGCLPLVTEQSINYHEDMLEYRNYTLGTSTPMGWLYYPWNNMDHPNIVGVKKWVSPSGKFMGRYCSLIKQYRFMAPAGNRRGVLTDWKNLSINVDPEEAGSYANNFYDAQLNGAYFEDGVGTVIWGQKTLQNFSSKRDRINTEILLTEVVPTCKSLLVNYLFEDINADLLKDISDNILYYLMEVKGAGGLNKDQDPIVICDSTNNTPATINKKEIHIRLGIVPSDAAEYIFTDISLLSTGDTLVEVS